MAARSEKAGRNDSCPCGSGRKYKLCCGKNAQGMTRKQKIVLGVVAVVAAAGLILAISSRSEHTGAAMGVWSPEHGHYH
jgi:SEC-C motif